MEEPPDIENQSRLVARLLIREVPISILGGGLCIILFEPWTHWNWLAMMCITILSAGAFHKAGEYVRKQSNAFSLALITASEQPLGAQADDQGPNFLLSLVLPTIFPGLPVRLPQCVR